MSSLQGNSSEQGREAESASVIFERSGANVNGAGKGMGKSVDKGIVKRMPDGALNNGNGAIAVNGAASGAASKNAGELEKFCSGDYVVYPAHGLGKIDSIESFKYGKHKVTMISIAFKRNRMVVKVPVYRVEESGLRPISSSEGIHAALGTLRSRLKVKKAMWARRAQEYEAKINSGDPVSIAEVLRELHRDSSQGKPSFSERQIYQAALERLASELSVVEQIDEQSAVEQLIGILQEAA